MVITEWPSHETRESLFETEYIQRKQFALAAVGFYVDLKGKKLG